MDLGPLMIHRTSYNCFMSFSYLLRLPCLVMLAVISRNFRVLLKPERHPCSWEHFMFFIHALPSAILSKRFFFRGWIKASFLAILRSKILCLSFFCPVHFQLNIFFPVSAIFLLDVVLRLGNIVPSLSVF